MTGMAPPASPLSVGSLAQLTLSLLAIVALILALGWVLKRFKLAAPGRSSEMVILDELKLGPRERIALIGIGEKQVLVGIGAGGIVPLTPLTAAIAPQRPAAAPTFALRLRELMKRPGATPPGATPPDAAPPGATPPDATPPRSSG